MMRAILMLIVFGYVASQQKDCNCPVVYEPVCGSDGKKYPTECFAACFKATPTTALKNGKCSGEVADIHKKASTAPAPSNRTPANQPASLPPWRNPTPTTQTNPRQATQTSLRQASPPHEQRAKPVVPAPAAKKAAPPAPSHPTPAMIARQMLHPSSMPGPTEYATRPKTDAQTKNVRGQGMPEIPSMESRNLHHRFRPKEQPVEDDDDDGAAL